MKHQMKGTHELNLTVVAQQMVRKKQVFYNWASGPLLVLVLALTFPELCWPLSKYNDTMDPVPDGLKLEESVVERLRVLDQNKPSDFGIRNNCLNANRIRHINFKDDKTAYVDVGRGRQVILTLAEECRGIRHSGFVQKTRTNRLCARFDSLEIIHTGMRCRIESLEPHITLDNDDLAPE